MTTQPRRPLVLIVEDDRDTREMYALFLDMSGMSVLTASSMETGFALAAEHHPDIIVTDLILDGREDGTELCRRLRADPRTSQIPAMLLTGSTRTAEADAALGAGCYAIRTKPHLPDALLSDIREILARPENHRLAG